MFWFGLLFCLFLTSVLFRLYGGRAEPEHLLTAAAAYAVIQLIANIA